MVSLEPLRTPLFVPGNRPDRVDKAVGTEADAVIIDLEDTVPPELKPGARETVREKLAQHAGRKIIMRTNALDTGLLGEDLQAVSPELAALIVPKVDTAEQVAEIHGLILQAEKQKGMEPGSLPVIALIETALAVQNIFAIVSAKTDPPRIYTVAFGAADYTLDLGIEMTMEGEELAYARSRIAVACRAARVAPPLDTPFMIDIKNVEAFEADARRAKRLGYQGKLCIHPNQIAPGNRIFSPTEEEIEFAEKVIQAFEEAEGAGSASIQVDGKFVDYPIVERARRIVKTAGR